MLLEMDRWRELIVEKGVDIRVIDAEAPSYMPTEWALGCDDYMYEWGFDTEEDALYRLQEIKKKIGVEEREKAVH